MAYERVNWENLPSTKTPINQTNLNKMENGIDQAGAEIFVGTEEPTTGEKVWFNKNKNSIYVRNSNGVYEEFTTNIVNILSGNEKDKAPSVNCINMALASLTNAKIIWYGDFNTLYKEKNGLFCGLAMKNPPVNYTSDASTSNWYILQIYYSDSYYIQIATTLLDHLNYNKKIYMRKCFNGKLSSWTSIAFS